MYQQPVNVTPIDQLYNRDNSPQSPSVSKFIRGSSFSPADESGMNAYPQYNMGSNPGPNSNPGMGVGNSSVPHNGMDDMARQRMKVQQHLLAHQPQQPQQQPPVRPQIKEMMPKLTQADNLNCLDICKHVEKCPMCSKFFDTDKTMYILVIVLLFIMIGFLVKKLIDCNSR
jgi:hypothetical protein